MEPIKSSKCKDGSLSIKWPNERWWLVNKFPSINTTKNSRTQTTESKHLKNNGVLVVKLSNKVSTKENKCVEQLTVQDIFLYHKKTSRYKCVAAGLILNF